MKLILFNKDNDQVEIHYGVGFALLFGAYFLGSFMYVISSWLTKALLKFSPLAGLSIMVFGLALGYFYRAVRGPRVEVCHCDSEQND